METEQKTDGKLSSLTKWDLIFPCDPRVKSDPARQVEVSSCQGGII